MPDKVDAAIAAAAASELRWQGVITLPSGRQAVLNIPADITAEEALALTGATVQACFQVQAQAARGPQLVVPRPQLLRPA
jgi:hypothetical protein